MTVTELLTQSTGGQAQPSDPVVALKQSIDPESGQQPSALDIVCGLAVLLLVFYGVHMMHRRGRGRE